jgi:imidazole glycerol-phosphate synthase subunit HisF
MKVKRIIPRLDIKGPNVVKGIHLEGLRVLGNPADFAQHYYEQGADELMFMDVVASLYQRNSLHAIISETAKRIFIPLTVGGGLRTIEDIRSVLRAGADKVCINTGAVQQPEFIAEASRIFGSSTIVVAIEAIRGGDGKYYAYTDNGREVTGLEVMEWAKKIEALGAGEIVITSVDKEGTGEGFDIALINLVADAVSIPVVAHGGPGEARHVVPVLANTQADAVAIASMFHYEYVLHQQTAQTEASEGNTEFIRQKRAFHTFKPIGIQQLKQELMKQGLACRL